MTRNEKIVRENIEEAAKEFANAKSKEFAEKAREEVISNLSKNRQGEEGLIKYVGEVEQNRDSLGRFAEGYSFEIRHPTAKLHERGGEIEPTYGRAMGEGWDRDGFYDALDDCNYQVRKKRYLRNAIMSTMSDMR